MFKNYNSSFLRQHIVNQWFLFIYLLTSAALGQVHMNYVDLLWVEDGQPCLNPFNAELNPICHLLALGAHRILHVSRIRVNNHKSHDGMSWCHASLFQHVSGCGVWGSHNSGSAECCHLRLISHSLEETFMYAKNVSMFWPDCVVSHPGRQY